MLPSVPKPLIVAGIVIIGALEVVRLAPTALLLQSQLLGQQGENEGKALSPDAVRAQIEQQKATAAQALTQAQLNDAQTQVTKLQSALTQAQTDKTRAEAAQSASQTVINTLQARVTELQAGLTQAQTAKTIAEAFVTRLQAALTSAQTTKTAAEERLTTINADQADFQNRLSRQMTISMLNGPMGAILGAMGVDVNGAANNRPTASAHYATVKATTNLNLRTGPGVSYPVDHMMSSGTRVQILRQMDDGWYEVADNSSGTIVRGYAKGDFLDME